MRGWAGWGGASNAAHGYVFVLNRRTTSCILRGFPQVRLISSTGRVLSIKLIHTSLEDQALEEGAPRADPRHGVLRPGHQGAMAVMWADWCGGPLHEPLSLEIVPQGGGRLRMRVHDWPPGYSQPMAYTPYCMFPGQPSTLWISAFELVAPAHERVHF